MLSVIIIFVNSYNVFVFCKIIFSNKLDLFKASCSIIVMSANFLPYQAFIFCTYCQGVTGCLKILPLFFVQMDTKISKFMTLPPMFVGRQVHYSALFIILVGWHASAVCLPPCDIILTQLANPLNYIIFCLHNE